jgi:exodeoxyribonuclease-3
MLNFASFNVNGVRSFVKSLPLGEVIKALKEVDVLALQETKLSVGDNEARQQLAQSLPGYEAFFNTSSARSGYSGVAVFAKERLVKQCLDWFEDEECVCDACVELKKEGRVLIVHLASCVVINVYCPNGGKEKNAALPLKTEFLRRLSATVAKYCAAGLNVFVLGDLNVISQRIDIWYDLQDFQKAVNQGEPCMAKHIAVWLETLVSEGGMVDSFRVLHPGSSIT